MSAPNKLKELQLQALARRMASQPEAVRALLQAKLDAASADLVAQQEQMQPAPVIRLAPRAAKTAWPRAARSSDELASVGRFRRVWSRTRAQDSVARASSQRPSNAGPLNSHALVLQSLDLMGALPGDYLKRFIAHVESLLWLESASTQEASTAARRAKRPGRGR